MGNEACTMSSPQVARCEECLRDLPNPVIFEEELRGSRSFKVAKVRCEKGIDRPRKVVKIYQICKADASIELAKNSLLPFGQRVEGGFNLLPIETFISEKYAFISRDFVDQSLAERIGTRPFLTFDEKRWIAFQLLSAVQQLHAMRTIDLRPLCHGDIKPQNVLLTAWGWLFLADPAPFKPTQLPSDNPSEFTHIFDSSRHRFCYLAPERFIDPRHTNIGSAGDTDGEEYGSMPRNLNLKGEQSPLRVRQYDFSLTVGEVADENLENPDDENVVFKRPQDSPIERTISVSRHASASVKTSSHEDGTSADPPFCHLRLATGSMPNVTKGSIIPGSNYAPLQPSMDLFSVGCVLLELFTDGTVPFKLCDMLNYRRKQNEEISKLLGSVSDSAARSLITELISLNPEERGSATYHLEKHRGGLFPDFFFYHLRPFMQSFLEPTSASPAVRLRQIRKKLPNLLADLGKKPSSVSGPSSLVLSTLITASLHQLRFHRADPVCAAYADRSLSIITAVPPVLSTPLAPASSPVDNPYEHGLICLLAIVQNLPSLSLFNRLWPHLTDLTTNSGIACHEFRCLALDALVQSLEDAINFIEKTPTGGGSGNDADLDAVIDDVRFLNEFLLPSLSSLLNGDEGESTMAMAECLPRLTVACQKILCLISKQTQLGRANRSEDKENGIEQTEARRLFLLADSLRETDKIRDWLQHQLVLLLSDNCPDNFARRTVIHNSKELAEITTFLGQKLTIDVILGHLTTFLNAKDVNVRAAFFAQLPTLVSLCGGQSLPLLRPLLGSGLADGNEIILSACLRSLICLQRDGQLDPILGSEFIPRILNLTAHPSAHIRQCCIAFITAIARPALGELHNAAAGPLNDLTVETQSSVEDDNIFAGLDLFSQGLMGLADIHAVLGTAEIIDTYFKSPIGDAFTNDAVLLTALNQSLAPASLENVVKILMDLTNSSVEDAFDESPAGAVQQSLSTPRQLCEELLKHLRERQSIRASTRKGEHPWYPIPPNEIMAEVLKRLQALEITDRKEDQLLLLAPQLESLCVSASDLRGGISSVNCGRASAGLVVRVESKSSGQIDLPGLRLHCIPAKSSAGARMMKLQNFSSPELNIEIRETLNESKINESNASDFEFSPAYSDSVATRINEGRFALPSHPPPPNIIFSRSLTFVDDAVFAANDLGLSISSNNGNRIPFTGYLLRGDVSRSPSWVPNRANSSPRLRHLVHLHEHKAGCLSLALHPSEYRLVSCSSGDGQLKIWDLSRSMFERQPSNREFESEEETILDYSIRSETSLGKISGKDRPEDNTPTTGISLPSRSISTYLVQPAPNNGGDERPSCRYLVWTDSGSSVATLANRSSINLIDLKVNCQRAFFPIKTNEIGSATYLTSPAAAFCNSNSDANNECLQTYSYCGTDRNLVVYSTSGGCIVGQDVRTSGPIWSLNQGFDYGLITCLAVHSGHSWLAAGTNHNHLINWDLRYQRPISEFELPKVNSDFTAFTKLKIYDIHPRSTLICAATNRLNEVAVFALEDSKPRQSCKFHVIATRSQKTNTIRSIRCLLVLPPSAQIRETGHILPLPSLVTGGTDGRLRYWNLAVPEESAVLAWEGIEGRPRPRVTFNEKIIDGMKFIHEYEDYPVPRRVSQQPSGRFKSPISSDSSIPNVSPYVRLEMGEVTIGHTNIISDMIGVNSDGGCDFLISAAMNGVIKIWN